MKAKSPLFEIMTHNIFVSVLLYTMILYVFKNCEATAMTLPDIKNDDISIHQNGGRYAETTRKGFTREIKSKYLKKLSESFYKYKLRRKPKAFNYSLSEGWGAGGMPFNVLYTANTRQQKILKSVPTERPAKVEEKGRLLNVPSGYHSIPKEVFGEREKVLSKLSVPRKYYSFIPHLFVSYGW